VRDGGAGAATACGMAARRLSGAGGGGSGDGRKTNEVEEGDG
jgi:hypothetical protein